MRTPNLVFYTPNEIEEIETAWQNRYGHIIEKRKREARESTKANPDGTFSLVAPDIHDIPPSPARLYHMQKNETWRYDINLIR